MKTKEILKQASELCELAGERAIQFTQARGCKFYLRVDGYSIDENSIDINLEEVTNHDCPDHFYASLTVAHLEMDEKEWDEYVTNEAKIARIKEEEQEQREEQAATEAKRKQYEALKKEFGI